MSWYYTYYVVYKGKDGKFYPFGPYDYTGKLHNVLERSRSFASGLHEDFINIGTSELRKKLVSEKLLRIIHSHINDEQAKKFYDCSNDMYLWSYLPFKELPSGEYIKKGYCLIDDIETYENNTEYFDGFYGVLSPTVYSKKLENELKFGAPKPVKDDFGEEYTPHSMSEYSYYVWPDYECIEYEAHSIRNAVYTMIDSWKIDSGEEDIYILLVQG